MRLSISAPINGTGYGLMAKHLIKGLVNKGIEVKLFPIGPISVESQEDATLFKELKEAAYFRDDVSLRIYHPFDLAHHVSNKRVCYTTFEVDEFRQQEIDHLSSNDIIMTASQWGKRVIENQTHIHPKWRIRVVPHGVDSTVFNPNISRRLSVRTNKDTFVVLNAGKFEQRKGHDLLARIFSKAFTNKDNVELWMMPHNPFLTQAEYTGWANKYTLRSENDMYRKTKILDRVSTQTQVAEIMMQANCGFFPARAEGWNLELLEMMACGKPVVCLNYSGQSEYINETNSFSIIPNVFEPAYDGKWFHGVGNWACLSRGIQDFFVESLRSLYKAHQDGTMVPQAALGLETAQKFTWEYATEQLIGSMEHEW